MTIANLLIVFNLFLLESILSIDNSVVLAVMVKDLPGSQKKKALRYGLFGAYMFRGSCLFIASWLVKILWLKIVGGFYLMYLVWNHFNYPPSVTGDKNEKSDQPESKLFQWANKIGLNKFWTMVILVEIMDLAFSIDNIFAAVAMSNNFYIIMTGVAIGILAMRFVAGWFIKVIEKYPSLEHSAYLIIGLLALKLILSGILDYSPSALWFKLFVESTMFDIYFSITMMAVLFWPILINKKAIK